MKVTPQFLEKLHLTATVIWFGNFYFLFTPMRYSVAYVVFCSIYANFVGHFSAWQASRAEVYMDESEKV